MSYDKVLAVYEQDARLQAHVSLSIVDNAR